jgi:murein DD-endopeptidase MepM/ murein hydrolase activator NlpD
MQRKILRFTAAGIVCASLLVSASASSDRLSLLKSLLPDSWTGGTADPTADSARATANDWVDEGGPERRERVEQIRPGDNLAAILDRNGVPATESAAALQSLRDLYNPRALQVGQAVVLRYRGGQFDGLALRASVDRDVAVARDRDGSYRSTAIDRRLTPHLVRADGMIGTSLVRAGIAAGVPTEIMLQLIKIFSYDVDFQRDIQPGDSFSVAYEELRDEDGNLARTEPLLYAGLTLSGKTLALYRFDEPNGPSDYYTPQGASVKKALLRTPIDGAHLTSGFGMRDHPILGFTTMHRGVDFGAPTGTPIEAAGDGVIEKIGPNSGYGNYVRLRHTDIYETAYGHMSRFAAGLHVGSHVRQGDVIGYVGQTGLATGPHLHYEVLVKNVQVNPISVKFPTGNQLAGADLKLFLRHEAELDGQIEALPAPAPAIASVSLPHTDRN